jgi:predicted lipoprotein
LADVIREAASAMSGHRKPGTRTIVIAAVALVLVVAMALDTKVVPIGSDIQPAIFSPETFAQLEFPKIQAGIVQRAVDAPTLADAIAKDMDAAAKQYGIASSAGVGSEISVKFTGVVGEGKSGVYVVAVQGIPDIITVKVQTGPAINGTSLRDATGTIQFGQFVNQIEYQNAGAALNKEMKKEVLAKIDTANLTGKTISVVGAFKLINPKNWLVTPVKLDIVQ